jgi:nitrogen fixation protein NifQ
LADFLETSLVLGEESPKAEVDEEELMLRDLLLRNRTIASDINVWLAHIIARRLMEPSHLWEDLGLIARGDLTRLFNRHFPELAAKNTRNMRWKRFLYRSLCEAEGFSMCPSPTCDACTEFHICYGDAPGEAALIQNKRPAAE